MIDNRIKNTIKYPTALIINAVNGVGMELIAALLEQGAYVICVDVVSEKNFNALNERFGEGQLITFLDYGKISGLASDLRRLDYTFYLTHQQFEAGQQVSAQDMLRQVNYLDAVLVANSQFQAKFLLTGSIEAGYEQLDNNSLRLSLSATAGRSAAQLLQYFESLVLEYAKEASLDARVLRLGELMGDGMDLAKVNDFQQLLLQAVAGKGLTLEGDGLQAGYYLHVLDAAYGLIKAMFSEETVGTIYQVCYESPITQLTLAYRLQELEPGQTINFQHVGEDFDRGLKLKHLSPNLAQLGWRPRIDLDQAISESLVYAKASIMSGDFEQPGAWDQVVSKLKSLVGNGSALQQNASQALVPSGPVSRLIAERQQNITNQQQGVRQAGLRIRGKQDAAPRTAKPVLENWQNFLWRQLKSWQTKIASFGQITPTQFVMLIVGVIVFFALYFYVFSPVVIISKNMFLGYENMRSIETAVANASLGELTTHLNTAGNIWEETRAAINTLEGPLSLIGLGSQVSQLSDLVEVYEEVAAAGKKIAYGLEPLANYSQKYVSNIRYRPNSDSYLAAGNSLSYESELREFKQRQVFLTAGRTQMSESLQELESLRITLPFPQLIEQIKTVNSKVQSAAVSTEKIAGLAVGMVEHLGVEGESNAVVVIVDETIPQPAGGQVVGWMSFETKNGGITQAIARTSNLTSAGVELPAHILAKYNAVSSETKDKLNWFDIAALYSEADVYYAVNRLWQKETQSTKNLNSVTVLSLSALKDMWAKLGGVNVEGQELNDLNLMGQLALTENLARRHELIIKALAVTVDKQSQQMSSNLISIMQTVALTTENDKIRAYQPNRENSIMQNSGDWISINLIADNRLGSNGKFPFVSQASEIVVENSGKLKHQATVNTATVENLSGVEVCMPLVAKNIEFVGLDLADYQLHTFNDARCAVIRSENFEFKVNWEVTAFAKTAGGSYNLLIGILKPISSRLESSIEVEVDSGLRIQSVIPATLVVEGAFAFTELLDNNKTLEITLGE